MTLAVEDSDNVVVFRRDRRSGELEDTGKRATMKMARRGSVSEALSKERSEETWGKNGAVTDFDHFWDGL